MSVELLPALGGKLRTLSLDGGPNLLLEPPDLPYAPATSITPFEERDTSGFDECFPTVAECVSPDDPSVMLPDHGELWRVPWEGDGWQLQAQSSLGLFDRRLTIERAVLRIDYALKASRSGRYLWSAHPLLAASTGSTVELPPEVTSLCVEWSSVSAEAQTVTLPGSDRVDGRDGTMPGLGSRPANGAYGTMEWPGPYRVDGTLGTAFKLFTDKLAERWCAYHDARTGHSLRYTFDVPYLGVWISQNGWPTSRAAKHFTVALEPCSGRPDSLAVAAAQGTCPSIAAGEVHRWTIEIALTKR
ncbi:MAG: hypothetical protein ACT4TC_21700 [Myxococcaceae bacterium]